MTLWVALSSRILRRTIDSVASSLYPPSGPQIKPPKVTEKRVYDKEDLVEMRFEVKKQ